MVSIPLNCQIRNGRAFIALSVISLVSLFLGSNWFSSDYGWGGGRKNKGHLVDRMVERETTSRL